MKRNLADSPAVVRAAKRLKRPPKEISDAVKARRDRVREVSTPPRLPRFDPPKPPEIPDHISVLRAAKRLKRSHAAVSGMIARGEIATIMVGSKRRVVESSVDKIINSCIDSANNK